MRPIDADALKNVFEEDGHLSGYIEGFIDDMPTLDVAPVVHGRWIRLQHSGSIVCSNCGRRIRKNCGNDYADFENHCPNCGARMDKED